MSEFLQALRTWCRSLGEQDVMEDVHKVCLISVNKFMSLFHVFNIGVILFSESDLHHADFWCKSNDSEDVLPQFQRSWR